MTRTITTSMTLAMCAGLALAQPTVDGVYEPDPELGPFPHSRCADSFLEFVWRWDLENRIWYTTMWDNQELTDPELVDYVARYDADGEHARWEEGDGRWG